MPKPTTHAGYFQRYIEQVPENDLITAFKNQSAGIEDFLSTITEEKSAYAYAEGKWSIKELLQHVIDTERIFNYRALCFARGKVPTCPALKKTTMQLIHTPTTEAGKV